MAGVYVAWNGSGRYTCNANNLINYESLLALNQEVNLNFNEENFELRQAMVL